MATYLRFTETAEEDIEKGYSYLKTPSMKKAKKLKGLCAFKFDTWLDGEFNREMTKEEIVIEIKKIASNQYYLNTNTAVLIEGDYLESNQNGEGSVISANYIIDTFYL